MTLSDLYLANPRIRLNEGVARKGDTYVFDFEMDGRGDFVNLVHVDTQPPRKETPIRVYRAFKIKGVSNEEAKNFKQAMKYLPGSIDIDDWVRMIDLGVTRFATQENLSRFQLIVTPDSTSHLANNIATSLEEHIDRKVICRGGLVKAALENVKIDEEALILSTPVGYSADAINSLVNQARSYLKSATKTGTFNMKGIPTNLRRYISGFLEFANDKHRVVVEAILKGGPILFVDDFETTRSTILEVNRLVKAVNPDCELISFVLLT